MKKSHILALMVATVALLFTACKKDDPVDEHDNEEIGKITLSFKNNETQTVSSVTYVAGQTTTPALTLAKGTYTLSIAMEDFEGGDATEEIREDADEHQFFFVGPTKEQVEYTYGDDKVGLTGTWKVLKAAESVPTNVILVHALDKSKTTVDQWNQSNPTSIAGGTVDISISVNLKFTE